MLIYSSIIFIHELGHFLTAIYYHWNVDKIYFYPYGGFSKFNEDINRPLKQELLILIMGPIFQILFFILLSLISISDSIYELYRNYHYSILLFNLIPIYPLDGGKLVNLLTNYFFPFKKSFRYTLIISYFIFLVISFYLSIISYNFNFILILLLLLTKLIEETRKYKYYYQKFLLERYLNKYVFHKRKVIKNFDEMSRDYYHLFKGDNRYYTEKELIKKRFHYKI